MNILSHHSFQLISNNFRMQNGMHQRVNVNAIFEDFKPIFRTKNYRIEDDILPEKISHNS